MLVRVFEFTPEPEDSNEEILEDILEIITALEARDNKTLCELTAAEFTEAIELFQIELDGFMPRQN